MTGRQVTGMVTNVERIGTTAAGTPIHRVTLGDIEEVPGYATFRISNGVDLNYKITDAEYRAKLYVFALTRAGRISHVIGRWGDI